MRSNSWKERLTTILVSAWHPKLSSIPSTLKNNFHLISSNPKLSKILKQKPTVTYRKNKSLSDQLSNNDIANQQLHSNVAPFGKCKLCPQINTAKLFTNDKLNITLKKMLHNVPSTRCYVLDIQENNFQSASRNIAVTLKTGQRTVNLQRILTKVLI